MSYLTLLFIAVGLSMDALAVAVATGAAMRRLDWRKAFRLAIFFGGFQALMPIVGWLAGIGFKTIIHSFDHWIAFGLLSAIGVKMIYESRKLPEADRGTLCEQTLFVTLSLAFATSIDALAVGVSFSFLNIYIPLPAMIIGLTTFTISFAGVYIGTKIGHFFERTIATLGGLTLILIGAKILIEHLTMAQ